MGKRAAKRARSQPAAIAEQAAQAEREARKAPKLRCWQDEKRNLHLASNLAGAASLVRAVESLSSAPHRAVVLAMADDPFEPKHNPMWSEGVRRVFARLRLEWTDDATQVERMYAHPLDGETAEIRLSPSFLPEFLDACRSMADGDGDFGVGHSRRRWKMTTLDKHSGEVWFWGERETPNTFRKPHVVA